MFILLGDWVSSLDWVSGEGFVFIYITICRCLFIVTQICAGLGIKPWQLRFGARIRLLAGGSNGSIYWDLQASRLLLLGPTFSSGTKYSRGFSHDQLGVLLSPTFPALTNHNPFTLFAGDGSGISLVLLNHLG